MNRQRLSRCHGVIYAIRNTANAKLYVGATTYPPSGRLYVFRTASRNPSKYRRIHNLLSQAMAEIGEDKFSVEALQECGSDAELQQAEREWIGRLDSVAPGGYNIERGGRDYRDRGPSGLATGASLRGVRKSPEHLEHLRGSRGPRRLTRAMLEEIRSLRGTMTTKAIGERFGYPRTYICRLMKHTPTRFVAEASHA